MSLRERQGRPRMRLFLALELPEPAHSQLAAWRDEALGGTDELRPVPAEYMHVTLVFLGWRCERDADRIAVAAFESLAGLPPVALAPRGLIPVPKRAPRLLALDLDDSGGTAAAVHGAAARALVAARFYEPEKRPFWPHVTLARVKRGRRPSQVPADSPPLDPFDASVVTLYRSVLQPQGARYEALQRHTLG